MTRVTACQGCGVALFNDGNVFCLECMTKRLTTEQRSKPGMNCTRCLKWTEEPSGNGLCRACYDYANCTYPVAKPPFPLDHGAAMLIPTSESLIERARDWARSTGYTDDRGDLRTDWDDGLLGDLAGLLQAVRREALWDAMQCATKTQMVMAGDSQHDDGARFAASDIWARINDLRGGT